MKTNQQTLKELKEVKLLHYQAMDALNKDVYETGIKSDPYSLGLYNGMELAISLLEDREPEFLKNDEHQGDK